MAMFGQERWEKHNGTVISSPHSLLCRARFFNRHKKVPSDHEAPKPTHMARRSHRRPPLHSPPVYQIDPKFQDAWNSGGTTNV